MSSPLPRFLNSKWPVSYALIAGFLIGLLVGGLWLEALFLLVFKESPKKLVQEKGRLVETEIAPENQLVFYVLFALPWGLLGSFVGLLATSVDIRRFVLVGSTLGMLLGGINAFFQHPQDGWLVFHVPIESVGLGIAGALLGAFISSALSRENNQGSN